MDEFYKSPSIRIDELIALLPLDKNNLTINSQQLLQQISHEMTLYPSPLKVLEKLLAMS